MHQARPKEKGCMSRVKQYVLGLDSLRSRSCLLEILRPIASSVEGTDIV